MFLQYFKLSDQPFGATPSPHFLYQGKAHREALSSLLCGFHANRGFTALIAEPGMGKTTLLLKFLDQIKDRAITVFLFNTICEPDELLGHILQDLGIEPGSTATERHRQFNQVLAAQARSGQRVVLAIDEAQNLSPRALEALRLLTNFETPHAKLMQIVLSGQPQLTENLRRPDTSQLLQRISMVCRLQELCAAETAAYIDHHLKTAGYVGAPLFRPNALARIAHVSGGVPRVINNLCFNSLCLCRARNARQVDEVMVAEVISDLQLPDRRGSQSAPTFESAAASHEMKPTVSSPQRMRARVSVPRGALLCACAVFLGVFASLMGIGLFDPALIQQAERMSKMVGAPIEHSVSSQVTPATEVVPKSDPRAEDKKTDPTRRGWKTIDAETPSGLTTTRHSGVSGRTVSESHQASEIQEN